MGEPHALPAPLSALQQATSSGSLLLQPPPPASPSAPRLAAGGVPLRRVRMTDGEKLLACAVDGADVVAVAPATQVSWNTTRLDRLNLSMKASSWRLIVDGHMQSVVTSEPSHA
jgi:hypothetical protein